MWATWKIDYTWLHCCAKRTVNIECCAFVCVFVHTTFEYSHAWFQANGLHNDIKLNMWMKLYANSPDWRREFRTWPPECVFNEHLSFACSDLSMISWTFSCCFKLCHHTRFCMKRRSNSMKWNDGELFWPRFRERYLGCPHCAIKTSSMCSKCICDRCRFRSYY